jgi:ABC-2 type transport system permease protein
MMSVMQASWVIARRDFMATVYSRSFIFFMLTPLLVVGFSILTAFVSARSAVDQGPIVALAVDRETGAAMTTARDHLASRTNSDPFPG